MEVLEINKDNARELFQYWSSLGEDVPYFYNTGYETFLDSLFYDTFQEIKIFQKHKIFVVKENGLIKGFIQYGIPGFHFTSKGKIQENINIGVIRNLYYNQTRNDIGEILLNLALEFFKKNNIEELYGFYHAMGMSCNGNHGKLHDKYNYIGKLLYKYNFQIEHENIYYIKDMKNHRIEYPRNTFVKIEDMQDNRQRILLYDEKNKLQGNAEIKYIDRLTNNKEVDIIYLVWIGIQKDIKGKGIGTEFLNHIIDFCKARGYRYLHTDTAKDNKIAQKFYERNGFLNKGITRSYIRKN